MKNSRRLIIAGGGDLGREVAGWVATEESDSCLCFIDEKREAMRAGGRDIECLGKISEYQPEARDQVLVAIAGVAARRRVSEVLAQKNCEFTGFIHKSAIVSGSANIGEGCIVMPHTVVSDNATIGRFCIVNCLTSIGHDVDIGEFVTISSHVDVTGHCSVASDSLLGSGAVVLPGKKIGRNAVVGAGSVIYRSVGDNITVYAPPAKRLS